MLEKVFNGTVDAVSLHRRETAEPAEDPTRCYRMGRLVRARSRNRAAARFRSGQRLGPDCSPSTPAASARAVFSAWRDRVPSGTRLSRTGTLVDRRSLTADLGRVRTRRLDDCLAVDRRRPRRRQFEIDPSAYARPTFGGRVSLVPIRIRAGEGFRPRPTVSIAREHHQAVNPGRVVISDHDVVESVAEGGMDSPGIRYAPSKNPFNSRAIRRFERSRR